MTDVARESGLAQPLGVNWDGYEIYDPGVFGPCHELPRRDARAAYERLMASIPARTSELEGLLQRNGVKPGRDDAALDRIERWFHANVEADPRTRDDPDPDVRCRLQPEWYSVVSDVSLLLGEVMIEANPALRWEFFTRGRKNLSFQQAVISGFDAPNPRFHVNVDRAVVGYAHCVVLGLKVGDHEFVSVVREATV